jgi:hypothetical protein
LTVSIKKRCDRCGTVADVSARRRRCHRRQFGQGSYSCWGHLTRVVPEKKQRPSKPVLTPQQRAAAEAGRIGITLAVRQDKMMLLAKQVGGLAAEISTLKRRVEHYRERAAMSDEAIAASAAKFKAGIRRLRKRARAISLDGKIL